MRFPFSINNFETEIEIVDSNTLSAKPHSILIAGVVERATN